MAGSTLASPSGEAAAPAQPARPPAASPAWETWRRFRRHKLAVASLVLLAIMILAVLFGGLLWPVAIDDIDFSAMLQGPSWAHPLGTDDLGQDLLARMIYGGRISLAVGFAAMMVATLVGVLVGALAGMSRRYVDPILMWVTDLFLSVPQLPLLLLVIYLFRDTLKAIFGVEGGVFVMVVAVIGGLRWMPVARLVRAQFLSLREKEFIRVPRPGTR
jgi:peptide/nickel transport system permease protein